MGLLKKLFKREKASQRSSTLAFVDENNVLADSTSNTLPPQPLWPLETNTSGNLSDANLQPLGPGDHVVAGSPAEKIVASIRDKVDYALDDISSADTQAALCTAVDNLTITATTTDSNKTEHAEPSLAQNQQATHGEANATVSSLELDFESVATDATATLTAAVPKPFVATDGAADCEHPPPAATELVVVGREQGHDDDDDDDAVDQSVLDHHTADVDAIGEALNPMVYLTEDVEIGDDTMSVVSDGVSEEPSFRGQEIHELGRALEALEAEADIPSSPSFSAASAGRSPASFNAAGNIGIGAVDGVPAGTSPDGSYSAASLGGATASAAPEHVSKSLVKLYNDLALRLMDGRQDYTQALAMLRKAEDLLNNDASWVASSPPPPTPTESAPGSFVSCSGDGGTGSSMHHGSVDGNSDNINLPVFDSSADEAGVSSASTLDERIAAKRARLRAITYNNLGCLFKRRGNPSEALGYLSNALALEQAAGNVHDCASTHLNMCASYSALGRFSEALTHAERAILLLQRHLWGGAASSFHDGILYLARTASLLHAATSPAAHMPHGGHAHAHSTTSNSNSVLHASPSATSLASAGTTVTTAPTLAAAAPPSTTTTTTSTIDVPGAANTTALINVIPPPPPPPASLLSPVLEARRQHRQCIASVTVLAMSYHNAAVEHERLGKIREAHVSYHRACTLGTKFLGAKSSMVVALNRAQRGFALRQQLASGAAVGGVGGSGHGGSHFAGSGGSGGVGSRRGPSALSSRGSSQRLTHAAGGGSRRPSVLSSGSRTKASSNNKGGRR